MVEIFSSGLDLVRSNHRHINGTRKFLTLGLWGSTPISPTLGKVLWGHWSAMRALRPSGCRLVEVD